MPFYSFTSLRITRVLIYVPFPRSTGKKKKQKTKKQTNKQKQKQKNNGPLGQAQRNASHWDCTVALKGSECSRNCKRN